MVVVVHLVFFNDVIPFIRVCRRYDRFSTDFFPDRVPLKHERLALKRKTDCDRCLYVLLLFENTNTEIGELLLLLLLLLDLFPAVFLFH